MTMYEESRGHGKLVVGAVAVLVLVVIGLAVYGGTVVPVQHAVEKVIPNARFAK